MTIEEKRCDYRGEEAWLWMRRSVTMEFNECSYVGKGISIELMRVAR